MYQYVNRFRILSKKDGSEFLIQFLQAIPVFNGERITEEVVSSIILNGDTASVLVDKLTMALNGEPEMRE